MLLPSLNVLSFCSLSSFQGLVQRLISAFIMSPATLDVSQFISGSVDDRIKFARDLVSCLEKDGFVKLRNHGIPSQDIKEMFSWVSSVPQLTKKTWNYGKVE